MKKPLSKLSTDLTGCVLSVVGLAISFGVPFFGMFYGLRVVCWVTGNENYMVLMWFSLILVPLGGGLIFLLFIICAIAYMEGKKKR